MSRRTKEHGVIGGQVVKVERGDFVVDNDGQLEFLPDADYPDCVPGPHLRIVDGES